MHPSIFKLLDSTRNWIWLSLNDHRSIEFIGGCFAFIYLSKSGRIPDGKEFKGQTTFSDLNIALNKALNLSEPLAMCKDNHANLNSELNDFLSQLNSLVSTNVINNIDMAKALKELGENSKTSFNIPESICNLGVNLLGNANGNVYCPFGRSGEFSFCLPESSSSTTETPVTLDAVYIKIQNALLDRTVDVKTTDPIVDPKLIGEGGLKQFDSALAMPPFNVRVNDLKITDIWNRFPEKSLMAEVYYLRHMLAHTEKRVVCFVSDGFLFRTAAGEKQFKQDILEKGWLDCIIALPSGLLSGTKLSINVIILDKRRSKFNPVKFIDASGDDFIDQISKTKNQLKDPEQIANLFWDERDDKHVAFASDSEIEENEYNLSPARYVRSDEDIKLDNFMSKFKQVKLNEVVDIIRPQAINHDENGVAEYYEYGLSDLNEINHLTGDGKKIKVSPAHNKRAQKQLIQAHDVLVVCRGAVGKVGFVPEGFDESAIVNQAFAILRVKPLCRRMSSNSLFQYLSSNYGKIQLNSLATGTTALMLSSKDLSSMIVPAFTKEQQEIMSEAHEKITLKNREIESLKIALHKIQTTAIEGLI